MVIHLFINIIDITKTHGRLLTGDDWLVSSVVLYKSILSLAHIPGLVHKERMRMMMITIIKIIMKKSSNLLT